MLGHPLAIRLVMPHHTVLADDAPAASRAFEAKRGALERLPKWAIIVPLAGQWLYLSLRFGGLTVPSAANPGLTAGGLVGEGKREYFDSMGMLARAATAPFASVRKHRGLDKPALQAAMTSAGLEFPIIVKPDLGMCGYGVRKVDTLRELFCYAFHFPDAETMILQQYLPQENEAGIFYVRDPATGVGRVSGLALRYFPQVTGDGRSTIAQLIKASCRAKRSLGKCTHRGTADLDRVPAAGERVRLSTIGSTRVGGLYRDGGDCITPALTAAIDAIARDMKDFHFGRFDVRFTTMEALRAGTGFTIMEVNGAGSEAIEAWDPGTGLVAGLRTIFAKQRRLFEVGAANRKRGVPTIGVLQLARLNAAQQRLLDTYPPSN
jgi:hypothetical protein